MRSTMLAATACACLAVPPSAGAAGLALVVADSRELVADGQSSTALTLWMVDEAGQPLPDGTVPSWTSSLGQVTDVSPLTGGLATARFVAGTWPAGADLGVAGSTLLGDTRLALVRGEALSTSMHLHASFSEGDGTMLGHTLEAEKVGVDVMWWTDHDWHYNPDHAFDMEGADFESGSLITPMTVWPDDDASTWEWVLDEQTFSTFHSSVVPAARHSGSYGWRLYGAGQGQASFREASYTLEHSPAFFKKPLMGQIDFSFWVRPARREDANAELWVTVRLSAGVDGELNHLYFVHSGTRYDALNDAHNRYIPITAPRGRWTEVRADLSALAEEHFPELGLDQHAVFVNVGIRARANGIAAYDLDDLAWSMDVLGEELRDLQRDYVEALPLDPVQLVGTEISGLRTIHINALGSQVPFLPFAERPSMTVPEIIEWIHDASGLAVWCHMFGTSLRLETEEVRAQWVLDVIDQLLPSGAYGSDLIEVGYRQRLGETRDFLEVWDTLSQGGSPITGIGTNDQHGQTDWATMSNNFTTWVESASATESDLQWNLKRGVATFGDPTRFTDHTPQVTFTAETARADMGQVVVGATDVQQVRFTAAQFQPGWVVELVLDGAVEQSWTVAPNGRVDEIAAIDPVGGAVVRVGVWTAEGDPVLFTNPIYFYDAIVPGAIPDVRFPQP